MKNQCKILDHYSRCGGCFVVGCFMILFCCGSRPASQVPHFENEYVSIDFDTTYLDCDVNLGTMVLLNDVYYCFSQRIIQIEPFLDYTDRFYAFSKNGEKLFETDVSSMFRSAFYLYVRQDELIALLQRRHTDTLYFDPSTLTWESRAKIELPLFEDDEYVVTSSESGEWGGTIYFKDKHTGKIYEGGSLAPVHVSKYKKKYYVSNFLRHMFGHSTLYEIEDPRNMSVYTGKRPQEDKHIAQRECSSTDGMIKRMDLRGGFGPPNADSVRRSRGVALLSSFVQNDQLLHLYSVDDDLFICKLKKDAVVTAWEDGGMDTVYQFERQMYCDPWVRFTKADYHQLHLRTDQPNVHVIMEITPSSILVHYVINKKMP